MRGSKAKLLRQLARVNSYKERMVDYRWDSCMATRRELVTDMLGRPVLDKKGQYTYNTVRKRIKYGILRLVEFCTRFKYKKYKKYLKNKTLLELRLMIWGTQKHGC